MTNGLYFLGILEGYLHSKGEDAHPVRVWHALKELAIILQAPEITQQTHIEVHIDPQKTAKLAKDIVAASKAENRCNGGSMLTDMDHQHDEKDPTEPNDKDLPTKRGEWKQWQLDLLTEMKGRDEPVSAIAKATEKTTTQVTYKWYQLQKEAGKEDSEIPSIEA